MSFNTYIFVLVFFPVCLTGWILLNKYGQKRNAKLFLLTMSFFFCGFVNMMYMLVLFVSIIVNYTFYKLMSLAVKHRKLVLVVGITLNIVGLLYFKYSGFFVDTINFVFGKDFVFSSVLLPLGISFYTIQQISFLVDTWNGEQTGYSFIEYALFVSFFLILTNSHHSNNVTI